MSTRFCHVAGMRSPDLEGRVGEVGDEDFMPTLSIAAESVRLMINDVNGRMKQTIEWPPNAVDGLIDD